MKKRLLLLIFILPSLLFGVIQKHKVKEKIGQRYYIKNCSECHGDGNRGGNLASQSEWRELFMKEASELIELHKELPRVIKYLKSEQFLDKEQKRMKYFLIEFGSDSENIPSCYN